VKPPRAIAADQRVYGAVIGLVTDVEDPDGLGRVRIALPWFAAGYEEWARVAQPYAGPDYGSTWIPEPDAEVVVMFAHGDMRVPYVLGALYNPVDLPPYVRDASTDVKTLRTPSGMELSFDEANATIQLKTPGGASITLEEDAATITITATDRLVLRAATVEIEGSDQVTVRGGQIALN
jgi:phage baseplate assembly protein V